jgi:NitT/TauT family transport system substrate-binding protein
MIFRVASEAPRRSEGKALMAIVLQETQRALFYTPFYCALSLGAFRDEGLDVSLQSSTRPDDAVRSVLAGTADVSWGGPMRVIVAHDRDPATDLVCFCEVVTRDPFLLVGRTPCPDFELSKLRGPRLGVVREVPTPWCCLQEDLRSVGLDAKDINLGPDRTMAQNAVALRAKEIDVAQLLEPFVSELIAESAGHVWYEAANRGPVSYTSFYARRRVLEARRAEFVLMTRAIYRTQQWVHRSSPERIASAISGYFPDLGQERLSAALARYQRLGVWGKTPHLPQTGFNSLKASLLTGKLVTTAVSFEKAVDNTIAAQAVASNPAPLTAR